MKESMERSRSLQEQEQQLVTTHVYHMMMQLHQQSTLAGSGLGGGMSGSGDSGISSRTMVGQAPTSPEKSFLTRQRQCGTFNISR
ncbi:unnamed protein product [Anisakis simplex]|uniref:Transcription factor SOX-6 n=1 Tax=Anisakis simplex TaxID=6269 RepID=A0A0M3JBT0_ANISI|nr:unnamed protein product [Anisakis simplex]